ncbi:AAA family ATPase [Streptomyces sp. NPDC048275]|uniref:AAA family ATPase n=1 Tax=Streptomyces sp. NPDC048275 TaxID=3155629 RepID=UPI0033F6D3C0
MSGSESKVHLQRSAPTFLGRRDEHAALCELLETARRGHGGALVVHGEPGIGKTALLDRTVASVPGLGVLHADGHEYENELAFAGLHTGMVATELPDHVTDPDATLLMADLLRQIDCLSSEDVAETVAFVASVPRHVNLTEITVLPTEQAI